MASNRTNRTQMDAGPSSIGPGEHDGRIPRSKIPPKAIWSSEDQLEDIPPPTLDSIHLTSVPEISPSPGVSSPLVDDGEIRIIPNGSIPFSVACPPGTEFGRHEGIVNGEKVFFDFLRTRGFTRPIIDDFDRFITDGINEIFASKVIEIPYPQGMEITDQTIIGIKFMNAQCSPPVDDSNGRRSKLYPYMCKHRITSYTGEATVQIYPYTRTRDLVDQAKTISCGKIPIMIGSSKDNVAIDKTGLLDPEDINRKCTEMEECMHDPGGYFVINGIMKYIIIQQILRYNKIMTIPKKDGVLTRLMSDYNNTTAMVFIRTGRLKTIKILKVVMSLFGSKQASSQKTVIHSVPVFLIHKLIYGDKFMDSYMEIMKTTAQYSKYSDLVLLELNITMAKTLAIGNPIEYISGKISGSNKSFDLKSEAEKRRYIFVELMKQFIPKTSEMSIIEIHKHTIEELKGFLETRIPTFDIMICQHVEYLIGKRRLDSRDSWTNNAVSASGKMMCKLFNSCVGAAIKRVININGKKKSESYEDIVGKITTELPKTVTFGFRNGFVKPNGWYMMMGSDAKKQKDRSGQPAVETVKLQSYISLYSHMGQVLANVNGRDKKFSVRAVQMDQYGIICPTKTSDGDKCGFEKFLAIGTIISRQSKILNTDEILGDSISNSVINPRFRVTVRLLEKTDKLMINGDFYAWCNARDAKNKLLAARREGAINPDVSISLDNYGYLHVSTDYGRLLRPLLVVENNIPVISNKGMEKDVSFDTLLVNGCVEYVDASEQDTIMLAETLDSLRMCKNEINILTDRIRKNTISRNTAAVIEDREKLAKQKVYTHVEIYPASILSFAVASAPKPNHDQGARGNFQAHMGQQAVSIFNSAVNLQHTSEAKASLSATRPFYDSRIPSLVGADDLPIGNTLILALMPLHGLDQEDAMIFDQYVMDMGYFREVKYRTFRVELDSNESFGLPIIDTTGLTPDAIAIKQGQIRGLDSKGIPMIGERKSHDDIIIGKRRQIGSVIEDTSIVVPLHTQGIVDRIDIGVGAISISVSVRIRDVRIPTAGDKFAARHAQKGVRTISVKHEDMPFVMGPRSESIVPSIIMSPTVIPSRMTMGMMIEMLGIQSSLITGIKGDATAFNEVDIDGMQRIIRSSGGNVEGLRKMVLGTTDQLVDALICVMPMYFVKLPHEIADTISVRNMGEVVPKTMQPIGSRSKGGAAKLGEMERDALLSHGAPMVLNALMVDAADRYDLTICYKCGEIAVNPRDSREAKRYCPSCGDKGKYAYIKTRYTFKYMIHLFNALGTRVLLRAVPVKKVPEMCTYVQSSQQRGEYQESGDYADDGPIAEEELDTEFFDTEEGAEEPIGNDDDEFDDHDIEANDVDPGDEI
jgi:DNA-directed RNA polymerase beta subunit